jgi:NADH-quinone oxidoreductase subunit M
MSPLLLLLITPAVGIVLIMAKAPAKPIAALAAALNFFVSILILAMFDGSRTGYQLMFSQVWADFAGLPTITFALGIDGINAPLMFLATSVTLAAIMVSPGDVKRSSEFFAYLLLMSLGALGAFLSLDLFFFFIFHEFALIPTFLLVGIWGGQNRQFASMQMTLYLMLGSLVLLIGILFLVLLVPWATQWKVAATFNLMDIQAHLARYPVPLGWQSLIFGFLALGFGTLISVFPLHSWAPAGYASAPPGAAMLHAGVLKKFGIYGFIRVVLPLVPEGMEYWQNLFYLMLLGNILVIGYVAVAQRELPLMLGFSSVMHMGYMFLGLAAFNTIGLTGVVFLMVAHGLSAALLFGLAGEITRRCGETRMDELGGLAKQMPFIATAFIIGSLASVGMPGLANFAGEIMIFFGAFGQAGIPKWVTMIAIAGIIIGAIYQLRAVSRVLYGPMPERYAHVKDLDTLVEQAPYLLLIGLLFILGFAPGLIISITEPAVKSLLAGGGL